MSFKILHPETKIVLKNGVMKKAKELDIDDILLGVMSASVFISRIERRKERLNNIIPFFGKNFIVGDEHKLSLTNTDEDSIKNLKCKNTFSSLRKMIFYIAYCKIKIDPYFMGLYIFNDCSLKFNKKYINIQIVTFLLTYVRRFKFKYEENDEYIEIVDDRIKKCLSGYNIIPQEYVNNNHKVRLKVLAGMIDICGKKEEYHYKIEIKESMINDIKFLCESLGYYTNVYYKDKKYYINIYGDNLSDIPLLTNKKIMFDEYFINIFKIAERLEPEDCIYLDTGGEHIVLEDFTLI